MYVTLAFPPDTDTPGFKEEQKSKVDVYAMNTKLFDSNSSNLHVLNVKRYYERLS